MRLNIPLLLKTLEHIEGNPEEHDQAEWGERTGCRTTFCYAGHVAILAGWNPIWERDTNITHIRWLMVDVEKDGIIRSVDNVAATELGLNEIEADQLFYVCESIKDLREEIESIIEAARKEGVDVPNS